SIFRLERRAKGPGAPLADAKHRKTFIGILQASGVTGVKLFSIGWRSVSGHVKNGFIVDANFNPNIDSRIGIVDYSAKKVIPMQFARIDVEFQMFFCEFKAT
uniref:Uncharacterized protein n=1 Tax=Romanomermis culicivorax TaxID=13658 RepID=A0A915KF00_ROMCU